MLQQPARHNGGDGLGGHAGSVVVAGKFADITTAAHFHHHGQAVYIDGSPGHTN